jgi:8-oxo-dGTP diphosphatase
MIEPVDDITAAHWHDVHFDYIAEMRELGKDRLVASAVIVVDEKVLLVRRSADDSYPGMWEFPGGGVDGDEPVVDAIRREVLEETGIELPLHPRGEVLTHPTRTALRIVMRFDLDAEPVVVLSHEHDAHMFADIETIRGKKDEQREIYDSMRPENRDAAELVLGSGSPSA